MDATDTDDPSIVGELCHIVAESSDGPRGESPLTNQQRNSYNNLVVMCNVHHKLIDDQSGYYTVDRLHTIKLEHESFVQSLLNRKSPLQLRNEENVAGYVDEWALRSDLDDWSAWTSYLLGGDPSILVERFEALRNLSPWLLSRIWPENGFAELQRALENFRHVAGGFVMTFERHSEGRGDGGENEQYHFKKFYKIREYNEELYSQLLREYECQVALVDDYVYELTRAANLVCDCIRKELLPSYRLEQGALLVTRGMDMSFKTYTYRTEYQRSDFPDLYRGEKDFIHRRLSRDVYEGSEAEAAYIDKLAIERRPPWETE